MYAHSSVPMAATVATTATAVGLELLLARILPPAMWQAHSWATGHAPDWSGWKMCWASLSRWMAARTRIYESGTAAAHELHLLAILLAYLHVEVLRPGSWPAVLVAPPVGQSALLLQILATRCLPPGIYLDPRS